MIGEGDHEESIDYFPTGAMGAEHMKRLEMNDDGDNGDNSISISVDNEELEVRLPDLLSLSLILTYL